MAALILFLVVIGALSAVFALYGLSVGAAGYVLFFGLLVGGIILFAIIVGVMTLSMPAAKSRGDHRE